MKLPLTLLALCLWLTSQAQFFPVGNGLPEEPGHLVHTTYQGADLYLGFKEDNSQNRLKFYRWNQLFWTALPSLNGSYISDLESFDGSLYVTYGDGSDEYIATLNGGQWIDISNRFSLQQNKFGPMVVLPDSNLLIVGGNLQLSSTGALNLQAYDGNNGRSFRSLPPSFLGPDSITTLDVLDGEVWVGGNFPSNDSLNVIKLNKNNGGWDFPGQFYQGSQVTNGPTRSVFEESGKTYVVQGNTLFELASDTAYFLGPAPSITDYLKSNNTHYFTDQNRFNRSMVNGNLYTLSGSGFSRLPLIASARTHGIGLDSSNNLYIFPNAKNISGVTYNSVARAINGLSWFRGNCYFDANNNCQYDPGVDSSLPGTLISLSGNTPPQHNTSNNSAQFNFSLVPGTYNLDTIVIFDPIYKNLVSSCNPLRSFTLTPSQNLQSDYFFTHNQWEDLSIGVFASLGFRHRQGFIENYELIAQNPGVASNTAINVSLDIPANLNFISAVPPPNTSSGNTHTWTYSGLQQFEEKRIQLSIQSNLGTTNIGDTLIFVANISSAANDQNPSDNIDSLVQVVSAAFDPNDKRVSDELIAPGMRDLDYHIRFQNTGNDTAYRVVVVDTLDLRLPINKIVMKSASHAYSINAQNNILLWEFDNIRLPDSTTDLAGSQGYIRFSAELTPGLGIGDSVLNDAQIYFDFQKPIFTNQAKTLVVRNIGLEENAVSQFQVYPNPANERLMLRTPLRRH